jgi:hypothetical protein
MAKKTKAKIKLGNFYISQYALEKKIIDKIPSLIYYEILKEIKKDLREEIISDTGE